METKPTYITLWLQKARTTKNGKEIKARFTQSKPLTIDEYHYLQSVENAGSLGGFPVYSKENGELIGVKLFLNTALQTARDVEYKAKAKAAYAAKKASIPGDPSDLNF